MATVAPKARPVVSAQDMLDDAPTRGKWGGYLKLPEGVKKFMPKEGQTYRLIFLPWHPGAKHPRRGKGDWVVNYFYSTHRAVGPNDLTVGCSQAIIQKPCAVCEEFQRRRLQVPRGDQKGWDSIKDLRGKNREVFFIHDLDGERNNLQIWEESTALFGDFLRNRVSMKAKYKLYADFTDGLVVMVKGVEKKIEANKCTEFNTIDFDDRPEPISDFLVAACEKFRIDDAIFCMPYEKVKKLVSSTGGLPAQVEADDVPVDEEPSPASEEEGAVVDEEPTEEVPAEEEAPTEETEPTAEEEEVPTEEVETPAAEEEVVEEIVEEEVVEEEVVDEPPPPPPPVKKVVAPAKPAAQPAKPAVQAKPPVKPTAAPAKPAAVPAKPPVKAPPKPAAPAVAKKPAGK